MYDDTKLNETFQRWLDTHCEVGFGEHYAGDLLDDFCDFLANTKMLKRSPGRVKFGQLLADAGFDKRKVMGLTHWSGLSLLNPPKKDALEPKRYARTKAAEMEAHRKREQVKRDEEYENSDEAERARLAAFKSELESETRESVEKAGEEGWTQE